MNTLLRDSNEKEITRILEFMPSILEEPIDIHSFYRSQARINNLYGRAKGITKTSYMEKYSTEYIEEEFTKTRTELDSIYDRIIGG